MRRKRFRSAELICRIDTGAIASLLFILCFTLMFADVITTWPRHRVIGLRGIKRFRLMLNADRKNAMQVAVFRDGAVYFGTNKIRVDELSSQIADRLKDRSLERKVYVRADGRARYETVGRVLDQIRSTGIEEVAFLAED